jgi:hypothetical protein
MSPNPTLRPFLWGAVLFLFLLAVGGWPGSTGGAAARRRCEVAVVNRTPFRALVHFDGVYWGWVNPQQTFTFKGVPAGDLLAYATTQYAEQFWGPKPLKCEAAGTTRWELGF